MQLIPDFYNLDHVLGSRRTSDELVIEQYQVLSMLMPFVHAVLAGLGLIVGVACMKDAGPQTALAFPVIAVMGLSVRSIIWLRRRNQPVPTVPVMRRELRITLVITAVMSVGYSVWGMVLLQLADPEVRPLIPVFIMLGTIAAAYSLACYPLAAYSALLGGTTPFTFALFAATLPLYQMLGLIMVLLTAVTVNMIKAQNGQLLRVVNSRAEILDERSKAHRLAYSDHLTGLPNRRAFLERLEEMATVSYEPQTGIAVAMLDLDGFKPINDSFGHAAGDEVLSQAAHRLHDIVGNRGLVSRFGGDEFAVLIASCRSREEARHWGQVIAEGFREPFCLGNMDVRLGISCGVTFTTDFQGETFDLVNQADLALYSVKRAGRADVALFEGRMESEVRRRIKIEQALRSPEIEQQLSVVYQPIYDSRRYRILGFEGLARWEHPQLGFVSPAEFIALSEQSLTIDRISEILFEQALQTAQRWPDDIFLSFNLSAQQLASSQLVDMIINTMLRERCPFHRLELEITETALLGDFSHARRMIERLRSMGMRVVLDDFGAGYASIGYLREIQFDGVKLDGTLIQPIIRDANARCLLNGVLELCASIGLPTTAEMVEEEGHRDILRSLPVSRLQGYLFSRPVSSVDTLCLLSSQDSVSSYASRLA